MLMNLYNNIINHFRTDLTWQLMIMYMVKDYLLNVVTLSLHVELTKVIHKRSHAWREVQDTIHKMAKRNLSCINHAKSIQPTLNMHYIYANQVSVVFQIL